MCRLISWFYGSIDEVASDVVFNPPDLEQKKNGQKSIIKAGYVLAV